MRLIWVGIVSVFICLPRTLAWADLKNELELLSRLDRLPEYRKNSRVEMVSSYDRTGGNDDGFSGKYSFIAKEGNDLVLADLKGPGVVHRIWTPTPTDKIVEFFFDGETEPRIRIPFMDLFSGKTFPFVAPVVGHEVGGYYCYVPIPYKQSLKIVYRGPMIQFHQIQYRKLAEGETTESYPREWRETEKVLLKSACELWSHFGEDMSCPVAPPGSKIEAVARQVRLMPGESATLFERGGKLSSLNPLSYFGSGTGGRIVGIKLSPPSAFGSDFSRLILRAWWDGESQPAIQAPVSDFLSYAFGKPAGRSLLIGTNENEGYCYFPMPFDRSAKLEISYEASNDTALPIILDSTVRFVAAPRLPNEGRFYSVWRREKPAEGKPYLLLDAVGRGHYVGGNLQAQSLNRGMTIFFEGDDVTTVDGELRAHGTGSEDAFNGGWYALADRWDETKSLPTHGCLTYSIPLARTGAYRLFIGDKFSFEKSFNLTIEHGPEKNAIPVDYISTAYYYGDHAPESAMTPSAELRAVHEPKELEFWLQLLPVRAMSSGTKLNYGSWRDLNAKLSYETMTITPGGSTGFVKFELETPTEGDYDLFVTHLEGPNGGMVLARNRQRDIAISFDTYAAKEGIVIERPVGVVHCERGINTLTFEIKGKNDAAVKNEFSLHRIVLKRAK